MSKRKNTPNSESDVGEFEPDDDNVDVNPPIMADGDADFDDEFEFDLSLVPKGVDLVELAPDFVRPEGFLMVPRINKKTGEIFPMNTTFVGILHDIIPWKDNRGKERVWFACEATAEVPGTMLVGRDEHNHETRAPVVAGTRVGISGSGAINALRNKKGHFIYLYWTGSKIQVKNGDMWEIKAKVSKEPVIQQQL
jgi:hypothetical protein